MNSDILWVRMVAATGLVVIQTISCPAQTALTNMPPAVATNIDTVVTAPPTPEPEPTIVTSEKLNVDYLSNVGTFEGNVLVVDPRISVRADKMVVTFGAGTGGQKDNSKTNLTTQSLERIDATGGVVITQTDKKATSESAVYTAADGKVVLTGNPQVEGPDGTVTGAKITFWRDDKRMDVESSTRLILYPEMEKKKEKEKTDKHANDTVSNAATNKTGSVVQPGTQKGKPTEK